MAQYQNNVAEWEIDSMCQQSSLPVGQHCECTLSQVGLRPDMTLDVARM